MAIGRPPSTNNPEVDRWLSSLYDEVQTLKQGGADSASASARSLADSMTGAAVLPSSGTGGLSHTDNSDIFSVRAVSVPMPQPVNVRAFGGIGAVMVTWEPPADKLQLRAFSRAKIYRNTVNTLDGIIDRPEYGKTESNIFVDRGVDVSETYYYWVVFVGNNGESGAVSSPAAEATTAVDVEDILNRVEGRVTGSHLYKTLNSSNNTVFRQPEEPQEKPDGRVLEVNDIWFDTDDSDQPYRFNGENWDDALEIATDTYVGEQITERTGFCRRTLTEVVDGVEHQYETVADAYGDSAACALADESSATDVSYEWVADGVIAAHERIISASIGAEVVSINREMAIIGEDINNISAVYLVRINNKGRVTGFGLMSEAVEGGEPTSVFAVSADEFFIATPDSDTDYTDEGHGEDSPFYYRGDGMCVLPVYDDEGRLVDYNLDSTIESEQACKDAQGVWSPAGLYLRSAFIENGTITSAQIGNATIEAAQVNGKLTADQIHTDGLFGREVMLTQVIESPTMVAAVIHSDDVGWVCEIPGENEGDPVETITGVSTIECVDRGGKVVYQSYDDSTNFVLDTNACYRDIYGNDVCGMVRAGFFKASTIKTDVIECEHLVHSGAHLVPTENVQPRLFCYRENRVTNTASARFDSGGAEYCYYGQTTPHVTFVSYNNTMDSQNYNRSRTEQTEISLSIDAHWNMQQARDNTGGAYDCFRVLIIQGDTEYSFSELAPNSHQMEDFTIDDPDWTVVKNFRVFRHENLTQDSDIDVSNIRRSNILDSGGAGHGLAYWKGVIKTSVPFSGRGYLQALVFVPVHRAGNQALYWVSVNDHETGFGFAPVPIDFTGVKLEVDFSIIADNRPPQT